MRIVLQPQRREDELSLSVSGDVLTINGEVFDFGPVAEGAFLPASAVACEFVAGDITRTGGTLIVPIILPHGPNPSAMQAFPATIEAGDGSVVLPQPEEEHADAE